LPTLPGIEISDGEAHSTLGQLNEIFTLIEEMQAVDTKASSPWRTPRMSRSACARPRHRVGQLDQRAAFQAIAPETEAGLYLVPKVIE
jgi:aspartyl-tRNA(Asn)/glutamyl-tRNA(Gln) amidotransferase subunit C